MHAEPIAGLGGSVVIVSHRILIGAVAALTTFTAAEATAATVFTAATRFLLDPACWWASG